MGPKLRCLKCLDEIQSEFTHDFKECFCGAIYIDGGDDYVRWGGKQGDWEWVEDKEDKE